MNHNLNPDVTIIGAGLCGLALALRLQQIGITFSILEAQPKIGGRIQPANDDCADHLDLGPTWVWPYAQPAIQSWLDELHLSTFEQFDDGDGLVDTTHSHPAKRQLLQGQYGIARINGGTHALIRALKSRLKSEVNTNCKVEGCEATEDAIQLNCISNEKLLQLQSKVVVIAAPPRQAVKLLPPSDLELNDVKPQLNKAPTWMAPHAKVVIRYENAFWRDKGLSGRVVSQLGPLVEIHDHCGPDGTPAALFGFAGIPPSQRRDIDAFKSAIEHQLQRCFGDNTPAPDQIIIRDWAHNEYIATLSDLDGPMAHPSVLSANVRKAYWKNRLWFAASETSRISPGLIEGALVRADEVARELAGHFNK